MILGLSYYSNALLQPLILDHLVGFFIANSEGEPLTYQSLEQKVQTLYQILRFEFIEKLK